MSQIMPALCPQGQEEGESTKCGQAWTGGGGFPKIPKFVQTSLWMIPKQQKQTQNEPKTMRARRYTNVTEKEQKSNRRTKTQRRYCHNKR